MTQSNVKFQVNVFRFFIGSILLFVSVVFFAHQLLAEETKQYSELRRVQFLEANPVKLNFAFENFTSRWFISQEEFGKFYSEHTRNVDVPADVLPIDWSSEALLTIFWKSEDGIIRMPAYVGSEIREAPENADDPDSPITKTLVLHFLMNKPCFGIITDVSPVVLMPFRFSDLKFTNIKIESDPSRITNCLSQQDNSPAKDPQPEDPSQEN